MKITLPYPPSANRYWRTVNGRMLLSREARDYKKAVAYMAAAHMSAHQLAKLEDRVAVSIQVYRPRKRGDLDNTLKIALDALNGIFWNDDSQIVELHAFRLDDKANPRIVVSAWEELYEYRQFGD